jgi:excisionase family DNA binding protein
MSEKRNSYRDHTADNLAGCDPILVPVLQASAIIARSPRMVYEMMATGELRAVKSGRSTLILYDSIKEYVAKLSPVKIKRYIRPEG